MARPEKVEAVQEIAGRFASSEAALLTDFRGLSVIDMAEVRSALRAAEAELKVLKNTLTRIAVRDAGLSDLVALLEGPTAIAFCRGDPVEAARALDDAARRFPVLQVKGGVLRGKVIDSEQARALARLEPREVQLAKVVMLMSSPAQRTASALSALLRDLASMLSQVVTQKQEADSAAG